MSTARPLTKPMTVTEFLAWVEEQPGSTRYELVDGEPVAMAPERSAHALSKARAWRALDEAIRDAGLRCTAYPDGMTVVVDERTCREPDALVRCGDPLPDDAVIVPDPLIVVEVLSPGSGKTDAGDKLVEYFSLPSVQHYLVVNWRRRVVTHHRRGDDGVIATRIVGEAGTIDLDPPGLRVAVRDMLPTAEQTS